MLLSFHCSRARVRSGQVLLLWLALLGGLIAAEGPYAPYEHRAFYLYRFSTFTTWPGKAFSDPGSPLVIGVLGDDPFGEAMDRIRGQPVGGRKVAVRVFARDEKIEGCSLLFIAESEHERMAEVIRSLEGAPILTVAEHPGFLDAGGMINLEVDSENKLQFEVNLVAVRKADLNLNSQLLRLAKRVRTRPSSRK